MRTNTDRPQKLIYEFGDFRLCPSKRLLLTGGNEIVALMPKAFDTLHYLVRHNGKVIEKDELMREVWADTIVEENNLTQNISILRRVLGEKPGEHRFIVTVPGHGYKFVAEVGEVGDAEISESEGAATRFLSEPLVFAGGSNTTENHPQINTDEHELETEELKPKIDNQLGKGNEQRTKDEESSRFWLIAIFGTVIIGLSLLGFYSWRENGKSVAAQIKTVAVLPFKSLVAENRNEALELGMADTLISKLGGREEITVRPLSAIRRYNSVEQDSLIAGRELSVEAVLDGTIQTSGERIRVSAKLLRVADGKQLWMAQFDEKFTDIFAVQDSISERVAAALKIRFGNAEKKRPTENVEAYELYMKGRYHALNLTRAETDKAIAYFRKAIEIDPNYALAYVGVTRAYLPMALTSGVPAWEVMPKAKAAALRAVEIDETLAEGHAALGSIAFWYEWDWPAAEKEHLRALELNPNSAEAHFGYAHLLSNIARHEQALAEIKRSRELDPVSLVSNAAEGQMLFFAGRSDESLNRLHKTIDLNPNFWLSHLFISGVYTKIGMHAEAAAAAKKAGELSGNAQSVAYRAYALAKGGKLDEAHGLLDELLKLSNQRYVPPYTLAVVYNGLGESGKALDYLEKAFAEKNLLMVFLKVEPKWDNLRSEPRFRDLMNRMNFAQ